MDRSLGPFTLLSTLGEGGMGVVYRAVPTGGGPNVAVKTTRHASPEEAARIRSESRALATIRHPGIVRLLDQGSERGEPWYAMELLEGRTLRAYIDEMWPRGPGIRPGPYDPVNGQTPTLAPGQGATPRSAETWDGSDPPTDTLVPSLDPEPVPLGLAFDRPVVARGRLPEVLRIFLVLCNALSEMHRRGLVHRDLKPENVFLRHDGSPVLMDLGLVSQSRGGIGREKLEEGGRVLGTLPYMSPEQAAAAVVDARADFYSLGAMLYETLTGHRTVRRGNLHEILVQIRIEVPPLPSSWVEGVPPALDALVMRLLAKAPRDRVGHADDVASVLLACGGTIGESAPAGPAPVYLYRPALRGRSAQRSALASRIEALKAGSGGAVVISGESGAGKTFLAIEAATLAGLRRVVLVTGECLPMDADGDSVVDVIGAPLHPFRRFLQGCADRARQRGAAYAEQLLGPRARILAPFEAALVDTPSFVAHPAPEVLVGELARERVVGALRATLSAWAALEGSTVLVLDDLQWVDDLSFAAIRSFDEAFLAGCGLLLVCTWRTDEIGPAHRAFAARPYVSTIELSRLDRSAIAEMVADMLAIDTAPADLVDFLARETEGNPFFVAEYLRMAASEQLLTRVSGRWTLAANGDVQALPSPGSLTGLVSRRLSGLSAEATQLIEVAAVMGRHLPRPTAIGSLSLAQVEAAITELETRQILEQESAGWRFVHDKLREAAFVRIPADRRSTLHRAAALALEESRGTTPDDAFEWSSLAHHWAEAGEPGRAVVAFARAGDQALRNFSNRDARVAYGEALALAGSTGISALEMARWESGMADACLLSGETREGMEHGARGLAHAGYPLPSSKFGWSVGVFVQLFTRVVQAYWLAPFRERQPANQARATLAAHMSNRLLEPYFLANMSLEGLYVGLRCINLAERVPPTPALARGLAFMCMLVGATPLRAVADRWAARALHLAEESGNDQDIAYVLNRRGSYDVAMGRWSTVVEGSRRARTIAESSGDRRGFEESHTVWVQALHASGRLVEAAPAASALIEAAARRSDRETLAMGLVLFMDGQVRRGRASEALVAYDRALPDLALHGEGIQAYFLAIAAEAKVQLGLLPEARALADRAVAVLKKTPPVSYFSLPTLVSGAHVFLAAHVRDGDPGALVGARTMHGWLVEQARLYPYAAPARDRIGGEIATRMGQSGKAEKLLRCSIEQARTLDMGVERGLSHAALARILPGAQGEEHRVAAAHLFETTASRDWFAALS